MLNLLVWPLNIYLPLKKLNIVKCAMQKARNFIIGRRGTCLALKLKSGLEAGYAPRAMRIGIK
jgi:hypothetical protein